MQDVQRAKEYIAAGDVFQVVSRSGWTLFPESDPFDIYRALRTVNPSPYMYFLRMGDDARPGLVAGDAGARDRDASWSTGPSRERTLAARDEAEDQRLEEEMLDDEKERAEHVMLVDLGRNDLGRVSEYGSVKVRDLMFVERYSHVMHLVRRWKEAAAGTRRARCFRGLLPCRHAQRRAQSSRHADHRRTRAGAARDLWRLSALRRFRRQSGFLHRHPHHAGEGRRAYVQAGAGIVADSDPHREFQECMNKAQALLKAVELARSGLG